MPSDKSFQKAVFLGYRRSKTRQYENVALVLVDSIRSREATKLVVGKKACFENPVSKKVVFGRVDRPHGNSGVVRVRFDTNLPSKFMGHEVRILDEE